MAPAELSVKNRKINNIMLEKYLKEAKNTFLTVFCVCVSPFN